MTKPKTHRFDTLSLHAGARARSGDRRARDADLPDARRSCSRTATTRRRCSTWSARGTSIRASPIPTVRGARGAHRGARRRRRRDRHRQRPGGAAPRHRRRCWARARTSSRRASLYGGSHNLLDYTLPRFGIDDHVRRSARHRRVARGDPARDAAAVRRDARQSRASTCSTSRAWPRSRTSTACRCSSTRRSPRPT